MGTCNFLFFIFLAADIANNNFEKINKKFILNVFCYSPALIIGFYIALNPISNDNHEVMATYLKDNFGEACYMSCALLKSKSTISHNFRVILEITHLKFFKIFSYNSNWFCTINHTFKKL